MSLTNDFKEDTLPKDNRGTYVSLKVINCVELAEHFKSQGLNIIKPSELHCTVAYSTKSFEHEDNPETIVVSPVDVEMHLSTLGDNCIVLKINNQEVTKRHEKTIEEGATHGYTTYQAHITLKYSGTDLDISKLIKPDFDILLGNETTEPLNLDWKDNVV